MATPPYSRSLTSAFKRLRLSPSHTTRQIHTSPASASPSATQPRPARSAPSEVELSNLRLPKAVQATYLAPLKRAPATSTTSATLQLRSYSVRNLELYADFALRSAYYLRLAATGPALLPRLTERWTVPRSNFVHKKSQENFARTTLRRVICIKGGHPDTVAAWLAWLKRHQYYGVGMKADVWEFGGVETVAELEAEGERIARLMETNEEVELRGDGGKRQLGRADEKGAEKLLFTRPFKGHWGALAPASGGMDFVGTVPVGKRKGVEDVSVKRS